MSILEIPTSDQLASNPPANLEIAPVYDLTLDEIRDGVATLATLSSVLLETDVAPRYFVHELDGTDELSNIARSTECAVFDAAFRNGPEIMEHEYSPYEQVSTFFVVCDRQERDLLGVVRVGAEAPVGFKTLVDLFDGTKVKLPEGFDSTIHNADEVSGLYGLIGDKTIDVMTLAIPPAHKGPRSPDILGALYHQTLDYSMRHDIRHWLMMFDRQAKKMTERVGVPLQPIANIPSIEYLGSKGTYPLIVDALGVPTALDKKAYELTADIQRGGRSSAALQLNRGMRDGANFGGDLQIIRL